MRSTESFENIFLCKKPVDGRKQINGLSAIAASELEKNPLEGGLFVFVNKSCNTLRLLYWDRTGFAVWIKRLEKDRFRWPRSLQGECIELEAKELSWLLDGIDILRSRPHKTLSYTRL